MSRTIDNKALKCILTSLYSKWPCSQDEMCPTAGHRCYIPLFPKIRKTTYIQTIYKCTNVKTVLFTILATNQPFMMDKGLKYSEFKSKSCYARPFME